jgi:hypothetical protein
LQRRKLPPTSFDSKLSSLINTNLYWSFVSAAGMMLVALAAVVFWRRLTPASGRYQRPDSPLVLRAQGPIQLRRNVTRCRC